MDSLFKMALTLHVIGGALSGSLGSAKMEFQINRDQTWFEIVECVLRRKPSNHNTTWRLEHPCNGLLGTDVPLSTKVADTPGLNSEIAQQAQLRLHLACTLNAVIPYETVQYALAFHQAKLPWPLWKSNDVDVIDQEAMGCWDGWRQRRGPTIMPKDQDNSPDHLLVLKHGELRRCVNIFSLVKFIQTNSNNSLRDPIFQLPLNSLVQSHLVPLCGQYTLPQLDLDTSEFSYAYDRALKAEGARVQSWAEYEAERAERKENGRRILARWHFTDAYAILAKGGTLENASSALRTHDWNSRRLESPISGEPAKDQDRV